MNVRSDLKCLACGTPTLLLQLTGECGTTNPAIRCPFAADATNNDEGANE